jgi:glycosyltransferase involved in cell wall biosynthesis
MHVAIVHFTGPPSVGGVETLISSQVTALRRLDVEVTLVVGRGDAVPGARLARIPALDPSLPHDENAQAIAMQLHSELAHVDACWVHNVLTVSLHPALTRAIWLAVERLPRITWVAWCEDLTAVSAYRNEVAIDVPARLLERVTFVTISRSRAQEVAKYFHVPISAVEVIEPPIDAAAWLGLGPQSNRLWNDLAFDRRDPAVLVPAKLLEHKNLPLAVGVAAQLQRACRAPLVLVTGAPSPHEPVTSARVKAALVHLARESDAGAAFAIATDVLGEELEQRTVRELMLLSDLVFLPSAEEGFGLPVREAQALRVPVLCSDIPAFRESAGTGASFFPLNESPGTVARRVIELSCGANARERRRALTSFGRFSDALRELLESDK